MESYWMRTFAQRNGKGSDEGRVWLGIQGEGNGPRTKGCENDRE